MRQAFSITRVRGGVSALVRLTTHGQRFLQRSAEEQLAAWVAAARTHLFLLAITLTAVTSAPALGLNVADCVITHFVIALLYAKLAEVGSAGRQLLGKDEPRFERGGWFFAFTVTLLPLFVLAFVCWLTL